MSYAMLILMAVDGVLPGDDGSARRGLRRADHGGSSRPRPASHRRAYPVGFTSDPAEVEFHDAAFAFTRRRRRSVLTNLTFTCRLGTTTAISSVDRHREVDARLS